MPRRMKCFQQGNQIGKLESRRRYRTYVTVLSHRRLRYGSGRLFGFRGREDKKLKIVGRLVELAQPVR